LCPQIAFSRKFAARSAETLTERAKESAMQLVLGAQNDLGVGSTGAPLPAPPRRWQLSERSRRVVRRSAWLLAFTALVALGALHGATVAIGSEGVSALATAPAPEAVHAPRPAPEPRGAFWKPEHSSAERPPAKIRPRRWRPERAAN
jgi:hypothetical protein